MTTLYDRILALESDLDGFEDEIVQRHGDRVVPERPAADPGGVPPDLLTIGLVGGTGVGKSTIVNALAGEPISRASSRRPTTDRVVPYVHAGRVGVLDEIASLDGRLTESFTPHQVDELRSILLFDLPDIDSLETAHADTVREIIGSLDVIVWVTSLTKYGDRELNGWVRRYAEGMNLDNFVFVLNKVDEIQEDDPATAAAELARRFEDGIRRTLEGVTIEGSPRYFLVSALHPAEPVAGNAFGEFGDWLFHERDARELERLKSSNRLALLGRRASDLRGALFLGQRRERLEAERREVAERLAEVVARDDVMREVERHVRDSTAENEAAQRLFMADLHTWPLLPHLRVLTAPLRQAARTLTRARVLVDPGDGDPARPDSPVPSLLEALIEIQTERRRARSLRVEDGPEGPGFVRDRAELATWTAGLANECVARVRAASVQEVSDVRVVSLRGRVLRNALVWGPLVWFPLLQPILQELLNPSPGLASLPLRLVHRLVRISGAMHLLVSFIFVVLVYAAIMIVIRGAAQRTAGRRCRELLQSDWWTRDLEQKLVALVLGDVESALTQVAEETSRLDAVDGELAELKRRLAIS